MKSRDATPRSKPVRLRSTTNPSRKESGSGIVATLQAKYGERLARASQELKADQKRNRCSYISDVVLFSKWAYRVGKGWYGFSLGHVPPVWTKMLDDFLSWLETQCPDFEIHQVKIKFRGLRFYVGTKTDLVIPDEKIRAETRKLEQLMQYPLPQNNSTSARKVRKNHRRQRAQS